MGILADIRFENPWAPWLIAVMVTLVAARYFVLRRGAVRYAPLQYAAVPARRRGAAFMPLALEGVIMGLLLVVIAGPYRVSEHESISVEGIDVALVLDISASMQAADLKPNRLEALKEIASDFIRRGGDNRVGIYCFAKHSFMQAPLTTDHRVLLELIDGIAYEMIDHVKSGGTAIGDAMLHALDDLASVKVAGRDQAMVLISDGQSHSGMDPVVAGRAAAEQGVNFYVVGIGGDSAVEVRVHGKPFINVNGKVLTTKLDDSQLREIAGAAGGRYYRARNNRVLSEIFEEIGRLETKPLIVEKRVTRVSMRPRLGIPLYAAAFFYLLILAATRRPSR